MHTTPRNAFEYALSQILKKRCVPVAGAGVSMFSEHPEDLKVHKVEYMVNSLKEEIFRLRYLRYELSQHGEVCGKGCATDLYAYNLGIMSSTFKTSNCFFCDVQDSANKQKLGHLCELYIWEFAEINDAYEKLVILLKIDEYKNLSPTPFHEYVAKLAREGLIQETITTNYDCNFEKAYNKLTGSDGSDVIHDLKSYRNKAALNDKKHRFKVYKINGCAEALGEVDDKDRYKKILLTELQLQNWRDRLWAADVFRDRLRSRTLFFNGFGSSEPQVHHTLQTVLEEYSQCFFECENLLETNSAPIVAIYETHPSFHQQQITKSYALSHQVSAVKGDVLIIKNPENGKTLQADDLWEDLYNNVIKGLLVDAIEYSQKAVNASFTSVVPHAQRICDELLTSFEMGGDIEKSNMAAVPRWLNDTVKRLNNNENMQVYEWIVSCLASILHFPVDQYAPVTENQALISELVITFYLLNSDLITCEVTEFSGLMLAIRLHDNPTQKTAFYLNAKTGSFSSKYSAIKTLVGKHYLSLMLGQSGMDVKPEVQRLIKKTSNEELKRKMSLSTVFHLSWKHIFNQLEIVNYESIASELRKVVESPSYSYYKNQPSIKRNLHLKKRQ